MQPVPVSLEELLAQSRWLRRLAATLVAGEAAAEDLVQETWLAVLRHPPRSGGAPRPWLARVARNLAANFRRGEGRRDRHQRRAVEERAPARDEAESDSDPLRLAGEVELQRLLAEAVLRLPEPERSMVVLRHLRGLDSRAIGARLGLPAGTVRWRLTRALEALRDDLDQRHPGGRERWFPAFAAWVRPPRELAPAATATGRAGGLTLRKALGAALVAGSGLGLGAYWLARDEATERAGPRLATTGIPVEHLETTRALVESAPATAPPEARAPARVAPETGTELPEPRAFFGVRAPIRGQLRIRGTDEPLDEVLTVRLRTGDLSVKETVQSAPDGSFRTRTAFPTGFVLAEVLRPAGDRAVEHEALFDPASERDWLVPVPWSTFARGRLLDARGAPLPDVRMRLALAEDEGPGVEESGPDGRFVLQALPTGLHRLTLERGFQREELRLAVARGPNELGDVLTSFQPSDSIAGLVRGEEAEVALLLTDLVTGRTCWQECEEDPRGATFDFEDVPPGDYRLRLIAFDGRRYEPSSLRVSSPATGLEFRAVGEQERLSPRLEALEPDDPTLLVLIDGSWWWGLSGYPREAVERWVVVAERHRPASGGAPSTSELVVDAPPGWGRAVLFVEAGDPCLVRHPLSGGEVLADGVPVARGDADGLALVSLEREPEDLDYRLDGWILHGVRPDGAVVVASFVRP